ncbi:transposase [Rhodococcus erythropolis]
MSLALGGDCLADIATCANTAVFGKVPFDPTACRLIAALFADAPAVLTAIDIIAQNPIVIDLDATLVTAHSEKQSAAPTYKRGFGFHPRLAFADHGSDGTGEPVAALLRPGNAGSNTAADHIGVTRKALAQLPNAHTAWPGKRVLVRTDGAVASHKLPDLAAQARSVAFDQVRTLDRGTHLDPCAPHPPQAAEERDMAVADRHCTDPVGGNAHAP